MAVITKIEIQKNNENRCNIYLDDNFYSGVESIIVFKYRLKVGMEIDKQRGNSNKLRGRVLNDINANCDIRLIGITVYSSVLS